MKKTITVDDLNAFEADFNSNPAYKIAERTVTKNGINASSVNEELTRQLKNTFSVDVEAGNVCNQRKSGRCWMFAGLNVIRTILLNKLNVKNIELSQAYLQFYDRLEKSNFYLERAIELAEEDVNSRLNVFMLDNGNQDGGHFVMFTNLVKKYGVLPIEEMPDLAVSMDTGELNSVLSHYLAQAVMDLRDAVAKKAKKKVLMNLKEQYLNEVYRILTISLGVPPKEFAYEYTDKDNKHVALKKMTPVEFYQEYIGADLDDYIALCDAPIAGMKPYTKYTCKYVGNVEGGDPVIFFNVPVEEMKKAAIRSLQGGDVIWFAADVSSQSLRKDGYLADGVLQRSTLFNVAYRMNKAERMTYRASFCNHAMTLTGVNLDENDKPNRWKVENSWGKENGHDGFYVMSDKWFDEYLNLVFINKKYVSKEVLEAYEKAKVKEELPFDTMWASMK
ncbi:MAG: C1 family peptidase [Bacilli bacterium]|nr:C1 family peptidase [Bacilli bacterium]